ncbi:MAG: type IV pilin protein [Burkholderiaceae bacterium]
MTPRSRPTAAGFTLIELMVTLVIVGILAAIAIPNYSAYVARGKRAAAKTELMNTAQALERNYTTNGCYNFTSVANCQAQSGTAFALPHTVAPSEGRASHSITADYSASSNGQAFTVSATPCGSGSACPAGSDPYTDTECGTLLLANTGARAISGTGTVAHCWQR